MADQALRPTGPDEQASATEILRLNKIIRSLVDRAERSASAQGSDFSLFQSTIMLEEQVLNRTAELETALRENEKITRALRKTQVDLVGAARRAGMAEIAVNVLHNVGNVLNSVNVSVALIMSNARASKVDRLARVVQLMNEHAGDLGSFLTEDVKGKKLPGYLEQLAQVLASEQRGIVEELTTLTESVDHVKELIAAQQAHARVSGLLQPVSIHELVEDALRVNSEDFTRHVKVDRNIAPVPELLLDKGRLQLILVNLIRNSGQAMAAVADREPHLTLTVDLVREKTLRIRIADNGAGIAAGSLDRVFAHGFTTRPDSHGFGLHRAAIAAREMDGTLSAHSDGTGTGATFTLELPIEIAEEAP